MAGPNAVWLRTPVELKGENLSTVADFSVGEDFMCPLCWGGARRICRPHNRSIPSSRWKRRRGTGRNG